VICGEIGRETNEKLTISQVITTKFPIQLSRKFYCAEQGIWQAEQGIWQAEQGISTIKVLHAGNQCGGCDREALLSEQATRQCPLATGVRRMPGSQSTAGKPGTPALGWD
jgi:hypothetical protein